MPSVMTTASPIWASTASITAFLAPAGGTKMTLTSAPVSFMASATLPNTGTVAPSNSTYSPAFFGFTPPTIAVPEASMPWEGCSPPGGGAPPGGDHALGVLAPLRAGHALDDDLAFLVEEDRQLFRSCSFGR